MTFSQQTIGFFNDNKLVFGYLGVLSYFIYSLILYFLLYKNLLKVEKTFITFFKPLIAIISLAIFYYLFFWSMKIVWCYENFHDLFNLPYSQQIFLIKKKKIFLFLRKVLFLKLFYFNIFLHILGSITIKYICFEKSLIVIKQEDKSIVLYNSKYAKTLLDQHNIIVDKTTVDEWVSLIDKIIIVVPLFCYICWFYTSKKYVVTFFLALFAILIICT